MKNWVDIHLFAGALGLSGMVALPALTQEETGFPTLRHEALDLTNAARVAADLPELKLSDTLDQAARFHAQDMLNRDYHAHVSPDGETPFDRFIAAGGSNWALSGENIATCEGCPVPPDIGRVRAFHEGWMQSPGHRENILSDGFDSFGFAIVGEGSVVYAVQTFSGPGSDKADIGGTQLTPQAARALALGQVNDARAAEGLGPLKGSDALDIVANRVLESVAADPDTLPDNIFGLLPEGVSGWISLALQAASFGGSGAILNQDNIAAIVADWATAHEDNRSLGGASVSYFGFAAEAFGDGRTTAVAVFGEQQ